MTLFTALLTTHLICAGCNDGAWSENKLIGFQYKGYTVATMTNSVNNRSFVLGYDYQPHPNYGILVGAASGYEPVPESVNGVIPMAAPYVKLGPARAILFGDAVAFTIEFDL